MCKVELQVGLVPYTGYPAVTRSDRCRLQKVQNPISDNTNVLWNSPSLAIGYPWFYKTTPFLSFEGKKQGHTHLFFLV